MSEEEYIGVKLAWKRIIAIAKNLPDPAMVRLDEEEEDTDDDEKIHHYRLEAMTKALKNMLIITSQAEGYIAFISIITKELDYRCPTSIAFMKHIIDCSEIPTKNTLRAISQLFITSCITVNHLIVWSMLAQKFAGNLSQSMWFDQMYDILLDIVLNGESVMYQLHALLVYESFALNGNLKKSFIKRNIYQHLHQHHHDVSMLLKKKKSIKSYLLGRKRLFKTKSLVEQQYRDILLCESKHNRHAWIDYKQLQFCLDWSLSHVFTENHNNLINTPFKFIKTTNTHCKISQDGLEIRNDSHFFESFYLPVQFGFKGKWYFEVLLFTGGIIQIGMIQQDDLTNQQQGFGIGNDNNGFAFDTYQSGIWTNGEVRIDSSNQNLRKPTRCLKGDVIGCLIDVGKNRCTFYINGQSYDLHVQFQRGLVPIICLSGNQHVRLNLAGQPWIIDIQKNIKPIKQIIAKDKPLINDDLELNDDWDGPLCTCCFSEKKSVTFLPCKHGGFGKQCAEMIDVCPLCRAQIIERVYDFTKFEDIKH